MIMPNTSHGHHRSRTTLIVAALCAIGLAARMYGIGVESLWLDEATSLMLARMDVRDLIEWTALDIHPPLYYTLLHFWIALGESEAVVRGLSTLAGVLNIAVIAGLGAALFDQRTGWMAALLLAVSPLHVWYSQEARMYAWVALWTSLAVLMALWFLRHDRLEAGLGYVLVATAGLYTHYYGIFAIGLANLFFLYLWLRRRLTLRQVGRWILAQLAVLLLFAPWLPTFLLPITVGGGGWVTLGQGKPSVAALAHTAVGYMVGTGRILYSDLLRRVGYALFVVLFIVGLLPRRATTETAAQHVPASDAVAPVSTRYTHNEALAFCLTYLVLPIGAAWTASQVFKPMYNPRYMLPFLIPFLLLVARGIMRVPWAWSRTALAAALVLFCVGGIHYQVEMPDKPNWRGLAARITREAQPGDLVLFCPGWHAKPFAYYAGDAIPLYSDVPVPVDKFGAEAINAVEAAIMGHPRIWFIWETDHYTDPKGEVHAHLNAHCYRISDNPFPLVGRIVLYENSESAGSTNP